MPADACSAIFAAATAEDALGQLRALDASNWEQLGRSNLRRHRPTNRLALIGLHFLLTLNLRIPVGSVMFGRDRKLC
jgi:cobalt-precorrin-5B (C1)-methyltransferase